MELGSDYDAENADLPATPGSHQAGQPIAALASIPGKKSVIEFFRKRDTDRTNEIGFFWAGLTAQDFTSSELTRILSSMALLLKEARRTTRNQFLKKDSFADWFDNANKVKFTVPQLVSNLHAFSMMGVRPNHDFLEKCFQANFDWMDNRTLAKYVCSMARLAIVPDETILKKWIASAGRKIFSVNEQDLTGYIWAFSVFKSVSDDAAYDSVAKLLLQQTPGKEFSNDAKSRINLACHLFTLPEYLQSDAQTDETKSGLERILSLIFAEQQILSSAEDHYIPELARNVDIRLNDAGKDVFLEVDGDFHFIFDAENPDIMSFNGSTCMQTALLAKFNPAAIVIRLDDKNFRQFGGWDNPYAALTLANSLKSEFENTMPGAYKTAWEDGAVKLKPFFDRAVIAQAPVAKTVPPVKNSGMNFWERIKASLPFLRP